MCKCCVYCQPEEVKQGERITQTIRAEYMKYYTKKLTPEKNCMLCFEKKKMAVCSIFKLFLLL